ncbi:hypothetical protein SAY87_017321 [Trapa incisa]|uniref:Uncharacterized protein n=1 Tax=Trapa incisa TaxID=236973 RepID=A0AAN7LA76_9MYRT|nr:hypothetical protein SAY87_017321 [Trapa incisa]
MGSKVREILLLNNQLTGCIPEGLGLFSNVEVFDVSYNSLTGQLPDTISCLDRIEVLNLGHNQLSGILSDMVCTLKNLMNLTVAYNFFSGFSQDCEKLYYRNIWFDYSANCIPDRQFQRPQPECSVGHGAGLSCLRVPSVQPLVCRAVKVLGGTRFMASREYICSVELLLSTRLPRHALEPESKGNACFSLIHHFAKGDDIKQDEFDPLGAKYSYRSRGKQGPSS